MFSLNFILNRCIRGFRKFFNSSLHISFFLSYCSEKKFALVFALYDEKSLLSYSYRFCTADTDRDTVFFTLIQSEKREMIRGENPLCLPQCVQTCALSTYGAADTTFTLFVFRVERLEHTLRVCEDEVHMAVVPAVKRILVKEGVHELKNTKGL